MEYALRELAHPAKTLGLEDTLLREGPLPPGGLLLLWSSLPSVVLGRFQNPWAQCSVPALGPGGIFLVRRPSGGGCVFLDRGNINFSFLFPGTNPRARAKRHLEMWETSSTPTDMRGN